MSALVEAPNQVPLNADAASPVNAKLPEDDGKQLKELGKHARRRQKKKDKAKKQPAVKQEPVKEEHADGEIPLAPVCLFSRFSKFFTCLLLLRMWKSSMSESTYRTSSLELMSSLRAKWSESSSAS